MISDAELIYNFLSAPGPVPDKADVIIALGTYDLRVADYAAEVFLSGRAPLLICSGGLGKLTSSGSSLHPFSRPPRRSFLQSTAALWACRRRIFSSRQPRPTRVKTSAFQGSFCLSGGFSL